MSDNEKIGICPVGDNILVERIEQGERKTAGGVIIPGTVKDEKTCEGKVLRVGEGSMNESGATVPNRTQIGWHVFFKQWSGTSVRIDDKEYIILKDSDIVARKEAEATV